MESWGQGKTKETTTQMQMEGELAATSAAGGTAEPGRNTGRVLPHSSHHKDQQSTQNLTLSIPFFSILDSFYFMYVSGLSFGCVSLDALPFPTMNSVNVEGEISLPPS